MMIFMRTHLVAVIWIAVTAFGQKFEFHTVAREIVEKRLGAYATKNDQREPALREVFEEAGCAGTRLAERPVKGLKAPNLVCTLTGGSESTILVGAHFDLEEAGHGVGECTLGPSKIHNAVRSAAASAACRGRRAASSWPTRRRASQCCRGAGAFP